MAISIAPTLPKARTAMTMPATPPTAKSLYTNVFSEISTDCPYRQAKVIRWTDDLPPQLQGLVVAPVRFDVFQEFEMQADRTCGRDVTNQPCYSEFRFVVTQLRSDDDEVFFEVPVYAETLTSWRLLDERWLICRTISGKFDLAESQTSFSLSDTMPR
jgi:hypothetical protein